MSKGLFAAAVMLFFVVQTNAQLGAMKLVGPNTKDYSFGFGAFVKGGVPINEVDNITIEIGANIFPVKESGLQYGTIMCPLKLGYRYSINRSGQGFYVEPQAGYNLYGASTLPSDRAEDIDLKYHGLVLAAGAGYLFTIGNAPVDLNLRYETVIAHGGSNNMISLGICRFISFGKRDSDY